MYKKRSKWQEKQTNTNNMPRSATGMLVALAEVRMSWGAFQGAAHIPTVRVNFPQIQLQEGS